MKGEALVVIPARYGSTRFPAKVLALLGGKTIVEWCYRAAVEARVGPVLVATEDRRVLEAVRGFGGEAVLTPKSCATGTDRVYAASKSFKGKFVINLQGDQPLVRPQTLRKVHELLRRQPRADIATPVIPLSDAGRVNNPNVVKGVVGHDGRALYFSRAPVPFPRDGGPIRRYEHLGIYGFTRPALKKFVGLPPSQLERVEMLEQLRALEHGMSIYATVVSDRAVAIDTPEDLRRAEEMLREIAS
ncbi:MAG: 3-deoxy-manno-octulosonate cytidylyltransferase [Elusimicrobia bacterium]|nr:3-deoxy-manno-octulosonate cytidylyltransferase [Elusimicrobiota bacterium]